MNVISCIQSYETSVPPYKTSKLSTLLNLFTKLGLQLRALSGYITILGSHVLSRRSYLRDPSSRLNFCGIFHLVVLAASKVQVDRALPCQNSQLTGRYRHNIAICRV